MSEDEEKDDKEQENEEKKRPDLSKLEVGGCSWECSADGGTC